MTTDHIDPSLRTGEPMLESLDDGFSPPAHERQQEPVTKAEAGLPAQPALGPKSPF